MKTSLLFPLALWLACGSSSGCSWIFVQPLPAHYERSDSVNCTTNRAAPILDTIFTLTNVVSAVYVAGQDNVTNKGTAVGLGLAVAGLWLSSAIYGYSKTSECEAAMEDDAPAPRYRRPVVQRPIVPPAAPPENWAPSVTVSPDAAPPLAPAPPTSPGPAQQYDQDDLGAPPPPKHQAPEPKLDAPRFGG
jgi:hypothetical protein